MRQTADPGLEFDWGPALWGGATMVVLCTVAIFLVGRPGWMLPAALVAGGVAGAKSGFYDQSGNNGFVAIALGLVGLVPVFLVRRLATFWGVDVVGDVLFLTFVQVLADVFFYVWFMPVLGYLGAVCVDVVRRRVGGSIGYQRDN